MKCQQVGAETCARNLQPGQIKRYPLTGPKLYGYYIACACGLVALWDSEPRYVEQAGLLVRTEAPVRCTGCRKLIRIDSGTITAT